MPIHQKTRQLSMKSLSKVAAQVLWNRLLSVVEEQAQALIRTAFSTSVREAGDLSAGVYNLKGEMLAQAVTGTPGHVNAMADALAHFIRRIGENNIFEDDVYITNNPWEGTGHLHDITVATPSFYRGELVGFFACTAHITDIGGRGFGADAHSVYEEGLHIPIMKIFHRGIVDDTLIKLIRANVRQPDQLVGDIYALINCNNTGHRRLISMMEEYDLIDIEELSDFILNNSRQATLECIAKLPKKSAEGSLKIDGYSTPVDLKVKISIEQQRIICDFSGTTGLDKKGINVPLIYTKAYTCYALKCAIAPEIPNNAASLEPFQVVAPRNSIVNAEHPAPVALRHVIGHMIPDTIYNALDKLIPNLVPAEGAGCLCNFQVSLRQHRHANTLNFNSTYNTEVLTFNSGGSGARPKVDGLNATAFPSGVMTMPVEATEHAGPIIIWRKELRPDSGGAGTYRGGLGQYMEVGAIEGYEFDIQAMLDRVKHPAKGRKNGSDGSATTINLDDDTTMKGKGKQLVPYGRKVLMAFPGGAGYGDPHKRDLNLIKNDLAQGYITAEFARTHYLISDAEIESVLKKSERGETFD